MKTTGVLPEAFAVSISRFSRSEEAESCGRRVLGRAGGD
jgi:hypothetical protein